MANQIQTITKASTCPVRESTSIHRRWQQMPRVSPGKWVAPINLSNFEKQVDATDQDKYTKKLTTKAYLLLFLHSHLHEEESLRAISDTVLDEGFGQAIGLDTISVSQLSQKNREVDPALLAIVFVELVHKQEKGRRECRLKSLTQVRFLCV